MGDDSSPKETEIGTQAGGEREILRRHALQTVSDDGDADTSRAAATEFEKRVGAGEFIRVEKQSGGHADIALSTE